MLGSVLASESDLEVQIGDLRSGLGLGSGSELEVQISVVKVRVRITIRVGRSDQGI